MLLAQFNHNEERTYFVKLSNGKDIKVKHDETDGIFITCYFEGKHFQDDIKPGCSGAPLFYIVNLIPI